MDVELRLQKALLQADRGDLAAATANARAVVAEAASPVLRVRALVVLGDLLSNCGETDEARSALTEAVTTSSDVDEELIAFEVERARELLRSLGDPT